jgi:hypothetical protein
MHLRVKWSPDPTQRGGHPHGHVSPVDQMESVTGVALVEGDLATFEPSPGWLTKACSGRSVLPLSVGIIDSDQIFHMARFRPAKPAQLMGGCQRCQPPQDAQAGDCPSCKTPIPGSDRHNT